MSTQLVNVEDYRILAQRRPSKIIADYREDGADGLIATANEMIEHTGSCSALGLKLARPGPREMSDPSPQSEPKRIAVTI